MDEHIRIGDVAPRVQYVADGVQTAFTYPFPIFEPADLEVRLGGAVPAGGFTVAGAGASEGGTVGFAAPPAAGHARHAAPPPGVARTTDFQDNGILRTRTLNDELDYQVAALQEVADELSAPRCASTRPRSAADGAAAARARANRLLGFDCVGDVTVLRPRRRGR